jgi:hypothetical protein
MVGVQFSSQERAFMVEAYIDTKDARDAKRRFQRRYPNRIGPSLRTIRRNYHKYINHGTSTNRNKNNSGRPRSARTLQNVAAVQRDVQINPSVRARKNNVAVTKSSFNRIT